MDVNITGILGICNWTENWKTALTFATYIEDKALDVARVLGECESPSDSKFRLELFWKGIRDRLYHACGAGEKAKFCDRLFEHYCEKFQPLRGRLKQWSKFKLKWEDWHYSTCTTYKDRLLSNLIGTEIDIVLETPKRIYIGEAKSESNFGSDGRNVLVHQLLRQFVATEVLTHVQGNCKRVVPFVVIERVEGKEPTRFSQVEFMLSNGIMEEKHILYWDEITTEESTA